ncbi:hypothetical protein HDA32_000264 [Spinactinospora alkalitolerans]|uniref:Uncharacterized protein n=1 Tax=Spinactinospora alkalitolerans TaxID=687207 RepID=A0A852TSN1_9ACTN|nr:hypothetical protein [Spinactinospora alkalitolerans]NYE45144.1 hypothetical protein [Spinactinospora alkalitolerans]
MDHRYRIEGDINSRAVLGVGSGYTDPVAGTSEMEVRFERLPSGWDPRTIVLMCCERATVTCSRESDGAVGMFQASGGYLTIGRDLVKVERRGTMRNAEGQIMVDVHASSVTDFRGEHRYDHSRIEGGTSHIHYGENGIAEVRPFTGVMMQAGPNLITVTTSYEAVLEDDSTLYGTTFYPHYLPQQRVQLPGLQLLSLVSIEQEFDGRTLWVRTESEVTPLTRMAVPAPTASQPSAIG